MSAIQAVVETHKNENASIAQENIARMEVLQDMLRGGAIANALSLAVDCRREPHNLSCHDLKDLFRLARFQVKLELPEHHWQHSGDAFGDAVVNSFYEKYDVGYLLSAYDTILEASIEARRQFWHFDEPINLKPTSKYSRRIKLGKSPWRKLDRVLNPALAATEPRSVYPLPFETFTPPDEHGAEMFTDHDLGEFLNHLHRLVSAVRYDQRRYDENRPDEGAFLKLDHYLAPHVTDYWHDLITIDRHDVEQIINAGGTAMVFGDKTNGYGTVSETLIPGRKLVLEGDFRASEVLVVVGPQGVRHTRMDRLLETAQALSGPSH